MNTASKTRHVFILFLADIVWGIAFVAQSKGGDAVGAFSFNGIRFLIGALCLLPVIKILDKKELTVNRPESKKQKKELWIAGSCCGIALFFASNLQQLGIIILYIRTVPAPRPRRCGLSPFRRFHTAPSGRTVRLWPAPWPAGRYCLAGRARVCPNSRTAAGIPPAIPLGRSAQSAWLSAGPVWRLPARPATRQALVGQGMWPCPRCPAEKRPVPH